MNVQYTGRSHFRELNAADFKAAGVEARKIIFPRGEVVEVDEAVGKQLVTNPIFGGEFKEVVNTDEPIGSNIGTPTPPKPTKS